MRAPSYFYFFTFLAHIQVNLGLKCPKRSMLPHTLDGGVTYRLKLHELTIECRPSEECCPREMGCCTPEIGKKVWIGVGLGVALVICLFIVYCYWKKRKDRRKRVGDLPNSETEEKRRKKKRTKK
eukprot:TCONS_00069701-protein